MLAFVLQSKYYIGISFGPLPFCVGWIFFPIDSFGLQILTLSKRKCNTGVLLLIKAILSLFLVLAFRDLYSDLAYLTSVVLQKHRYFLLFTMLFSLRVALRFLTIFSKFGVKLRIHYNITKCHVCTLYLFYWWIQWPKCCIFF